MSSPDPARRLVGGLNLDQFTALVEETTSIDNNLWGGRQAILQLRNLDLERDRVFAQTALGVERLAKVSLLLIQFRDTGRWDLATWKHHKLNTLDDDLQRQLRQNTHNGPYPHQLERLLDDLEADLVWPQLRNVLHEYGTNGRYYNLDRLAGADVSGRVSPAELWQRVELDIFNSRPDRSHRMTPQNWETMRAGLNAALVESLDRWWGAVSRFWQHGAIGEVAMKFSGSINLHLHRALRERN